MEIKLAVSPVERLAVYQFRYSVIVEELGVLIPSANHAEKLIQDADDETGHVFSASIDGQVVGTSRINFLRDGEVCPHSELLQLSNLPATNALSVCSRFLVAKEHRGTLLSFRIMQAIYRFMRQSDIEFDFILVKRDLVELYERIGYQSYGAAITHPEIGEVVPLRLSVRDEDHLRSVRSPLLSCLKSSVVQNGSLAQKRSSADFGFLPAECVIRDRTEIARYENNVTALKRSIPLVLRPQNSQQVAEIVREANRTGASLYPISTGKNWGLGSRLPASNNGIVLDLSELNRILEVNEALRYVVVEPGVTQGQLACHLADQYPSLTFNLTGAFGETGVLGNTLERGDGMYARIDDVIGVSGILGNGEPFDVGGNSGENTGCFSRYAAGPDLVGLFTQSNFGVVTRMTFRLIARNEQIRLLWGTVKNEKLAELFDGLQGLFADQVIAPAMTNVGYANRFEQARSTLGDASANSLIGEPIWNFYIIINGTPKIAQAVLDEARDVLDSCCQEIGDYVNGHDAECLPPFLKPLLQPLRGCPDYDSIKLVYRLTGSAMPAETKEVDLDQTPFGMKSYVALVPPISRDVTRAAEIMTTIKSRLRSNIKISFFGDGRALVTIHFLKSDPSEVLVAEQSEAEIWKEMNNAGYTPYRVNIGQMEKLFELRPKFFDLVSQMKSVFDPNGIIAPGRYCPT